LKGSNGN